MKLNGLTLLAITSLILVLTVILSLLDSSFGLVFLLVVFGQIMLVWTVLKVLKDDYVTDKTFDDFYEDHPIDTNYR